MPGIKLHPRHEIRVKASAKFGYALIRIIEDFDLSVAESMAMLSDMLNSWCQKFRKHEDLK